MKIDRHNYEEFFILYWDNELTASQKQAVENFVNQNSDLEEEFKILGETRFIPDNNVQFEEKEFLQNKPFINITNYEEQLLNYIDDELSNDERKEVEIFTAKYPSIQKELLLLQKTKLQPEAEVVFPDRSTLYKREEKIRVISMTWFRVAVAAAIILIAGFVTFKLVNTGKNEDVPPVAIIDNSKSNPEEKKIDVPGIQTSQDQKKNIVDADKKSKNEESKKHPADKIQIPDEKNAIVHNTIQPENKNNLPTPRKDVIANDQNATQEVFADNTPVLKRDRNAVQKTESNAINTSFTKTDVTNKPELALYIPEQQAKEKDGGGLKEFLRKTTRVFERRTKIQTTTEDNKLLLGAFAVSLK